MRPRQSRPPTRRQVAAETPLRRMAKRRNSAVAVTRKRSPPASRITPSRRKRLPKAAMEAMRQRPPSGAPSLGAGSPPGPPPSDSMSACQARNAIESRRHSPAGCGRPTKGLRFGRRSVVGRGHRSRPRDRRRGSACYLCCGWATVLPWPRKPKSRPASTRSNLPRQPPPPPRRRSRRSHQNKLCKFL